VFRDRQGKGTGSGLVARMLADVYEEDFQSVTLTTYRDISWNGPWYNKLGFVEVTAESAGPGHVETVEKEARYGHDMARRCVMRKRLKE